jgi:outer membrane receptor for ferrienterochelin and colicin
VNVGLKPRFIDNYEVELEYYLPSGGRASIGAFRKSMSSFIFGHTDIIGAGPDNGFGGAYEGWELRTQRNGGSGRVEGFEFDFQSPNLGKFVPFLQGLSITANYTKLKATGNYGDGGSRVLAGFQPETANLGVNYRFQRTSIRVRGNFRGEYLRFSSTNPASQRYEYDTLRWDINLEQRIRANMSAFLDVLNVTNTYGRRYYGSPEMGRRLAWVDNNGPQLNAGINFIF